MSDNIVNVRTLLGPNTNGDKTDLAFFWHTNMGQIRCSMQVLNTMLLLPPQSLSTLKTKSIMSKKHSNSKHSWNEEIDRSNTKKKTPVNYEIKVRRDLDMNMKLVSFCEDEEKLYLQSSYRHIYICMKASHVFCLPFWPPNWSFSYIGSHGHISSLVQKRRYFVMSTIKQTEIATVHDRKREWCSFLRLY